MKNNLLTTMLLGVLLVCALFSLALCWIYIHNTRQLHVLQRNETYMRSHEMFINNLVAETVEYSKRNPAVDPILEAIGVKAPKAGAAPAAAPAPAKPSTSTK
jgi:hypothetical protein